MSNNNPYINAYLQKQKQSEVRTVHPQQSVYEVPRSISQPTRNIQEYVPQYSVRNAVQQSVTKEVPREYTQFPVQKSTFLTTGFDKKDDYSGLNVFNQQIMKTSLETEKVLSVDRKTFELQINSAQKNREEIDKQLSSTKTTAASFAPVTIKVEKKPIDNLDAIAARRNEEAVQLKVEKVTNDVSALLGSMAIKKTDPNQLNKQMDDLVKRRQIEMQNIKYN